MNLDLLHQRGVHAGDLGVPDRLHLEGLRLRVIAERSTEAPDDDGAIEGFDVDLLLSEVGSPAKVLNCKSAHRAGSFLTARAGPLTALGDYGCTPKGGRAVH